MVSLFFFVLVFFCLTLVLKYERKTVEKQSKNSRKIVEKSLKKVVDFSMNFAILNGVGVEKHSLLTLIEKTK